MEQNTFIIIVTILIIAIMISIGYLIWSKSQNCSTTKSTNNTTMSGSFGGGNCDTNDACEANLCEKECCKPKNNCWLKPVLIMVIILVVLFLIGWLIFW